MNMSFNGEPLSSFEQLDITKQPKGTLSMSYGDLTMKAKIVGDYYAKGPGNYKMNVQVTFSSLKDLVTTKYGSNQSGESQEKL